MVTRNEFLQLSWNDINGYMHERWIDNAVNSSIKNPTAPFSDLGLVIERLMKLGASKRDLSLLMRFSAYEATFETLYRLSDPGIDDNNVAMIHESLLSADPSGLEGRPGSAPTYG